MSSTFSKNKYFHNIRDIFLKYIWRQLFHKIGLLFGPFSANVLGSGDHFKSLALGLVFQKEKVWLIL